MDSHSVFEYPRSSQQFVEDEMKIVLSMPTLCI